MKVVYIICFVLRSFFFVNCVLLSAYGKKTVVVREKVKLESKYFVILVQIISF